MNLKIDKTITQPELDKCKHISTFGAYEIYLLNEETTFLFAIDNANLICSCFQFEFEEDKIQLAHMNTLPGLKRQGLGKQIIREAVCLWTSFELPSTDNNDNYYFIENGLSFIRSCFRCKILTQPPFIEP